ncbi:MAG: hypothetical protein K6G44_00960 [Lentisphaeria bacterium]|nr:hypothetical protein [Lentisphaeria bacterium]
MNTNLGQSTEYTEETECLADVGHHSEEFVGRRRFLGKGIGRPPSARRFVTLRASANNVMRKLEVHSLSVQGV